MNKINSPLEIYKLLPKSNCKQCQIPTCLAFAGAVIKGQKKLSDCPHLDKDLIERFEGKIEKHKTLEEQQREFMETLKKEVVRIDFPSSADRLGASFSADKLTIKCLNKNFSVDTKGNITSECHVNSWIAVPLLNYVIICKGMDITQKWVPLRELKDGAQWIPLFEQRCEKPLKQLADNHMELFDDMLSVFGGKPAEVSFDSDISLILYPLPKVPMLICYCQPEEDMESKLNVFFDSSADDNINIESLYYLGAGLVNMFEKIVSRRS
ncbi:Fe-S cluster domain protein [Desulfofarcimen acetoxidans DSM 771]|jgi:hypothetical protein|uniref:Fe-S cluster domain protein n=1 Tax=Desulfofarcimen acetoxidans (strain ATCC 49208 / DSM 771 / KCTC 5769 / VKM B-1644 / 5575) TaxID=485916 RepID=C8W3L8_DESAS|nr:DUF3786 domain-containing protein [Desulfofarcimen acetoxidans]ACV63804.1 Fe-S cluster domain protein [Desulfofarcimen acetoxidans DSM 771]